MKSPEPNSPEDLSFLDNLAGLTCGDVPDFEVVHTLYESDARLRMDGTLHSYVNGGMETIELQVL